jgi:hypothetical protein
MVATNVFADLGGKPTTAQSFFDDYKSQVAKAVGSGGRMMGALEDMTRKVIGRFFEFVKQAVEIAITKFVVELCAMIIAALGAAITAKHKRPMDITASGVSYNNGGPQTPPPQSQQSSMFDGSAFDSSWSQPTRSASSW